MTNAGQEVWFRKSDGHEVSCNEGTVAFDLMEKDGSFERLDAQGGEPFVYTLEDAIAQNNGVDESTEAKARAAAEAGVEDSRNLAKLTKAELVAEAEKQGVEVVPDKMTKAQIIEAILAADTE